VKGYSYTENRLQSGTKSLQPLNPLNNPQSGRIITRQWCILCLDTPCTKDSSSVGACHCLGQDATNTMQQGC